MSFNVNGLRGLLFIQNAVVHRNTNLGFSHETHDLKAFSLTTFRKCLKVVGSRPQGYGFATSNTIVFSEHCVFSGSVGLRVIVGIASLDGTVIVLNGTDQAAATGKDFMKCYDSNIRVGNEYKSGVDVYGVNRTSAGTGGLSGLRWADGIPPYTTFNAILPPNAPSCGRDGGENHASLLPPSSYHPGGVNGTLYDGSVRFIIETINFGNLSAMPTRSSPSPYGVWGALGSVGGGESTSL